MNSINVLVVVALLCLALPTLVSGLFWDDFPLAIKIGMYALGFGTGVSVGALIVRRNEQSP